jgi:hypothetical protein
LILLTHSGWRILRGDGYAKAIGYGVSTGEVVSARGPSAGIVVKRDGEVTTVFIGTPSFLVEANVDAIALRFASDNGGRRDNGVVNFVGMDWEGERRVFTSRESGRRCRQ